jgi:hypothetical protein
MRFKLCLVALAATAAFATPAAAQQATATANATAKGVVLLPLTLTKTTDLDFGTVIADPTLPGDVTIDADSGGRSITGAVVGVPTYPGDRALFQGAGSANQDVILSLSAPSVLTSGGNTLSVTSMGFDTGATSAVNATSGKLETTRTIDSTGAFEIGVGGVFHINAAQPNGLYTGAFTVTADYQ